MVPRKYNVGFLVGGSLQHCSGGFYPNVVLLLRVPPPGGGHIPPGVLFTGRRHLWMFVSPPRVVSPVEYWGVPWWGCSLGLLNFPGGFAPNVCALPLVVVPSPPGGGYIPPRGDCVFVPVGRHTILGRCFVSLGKLGSSRCGKNSMRFLMGSSRAIIGVSPLEVVSRELPHGGANSRGCCLPLPVAPVREFDLPKNPVSPGEIMRFVNFRESSGV